MQNYRLFPPSNWSTRLRAHLGRWSIEATSVQSVLIYLTDSLENRSAVFFCLGQPWPSCQCQSFGTLLCLAVSSPSSGTDETRAKRCRENNMYSLVVSVVFETSMWGTASLSLATNRVWPAETYISEHLLCSSHLISDFHSIQLQSCLDVAKVSSSYPFRMIISLEPTVIPYFFRWKRSW